MIVKGEGTMSVMNNPLPWMLTSFLNICRSVPPKTSHLLLHRKLLNPSSLTLACPVLMTVFLPSLECAAGLSAEAGFRIGNEEAYEEDEKFGFDLFGP